MGMEKVTARSIKNSKGDIVSVEYIVKTPTGGELTFKDRFKAYEWQIRLDSQKPVTWSNPNT